VTGLAGHPFLTRSDSTLVFDGVVLDDLAREFGTPLYVYSRGAMCAALASYQRALAGRKHSLCYAMKANSSLAVLKTFFDAGCGFDVVSGGELARVLAIGAPASDVVFSGVGKTADEMRAGLLAGVRCFNVESEPELEQLDRVAREIGVRAPISLRVNPDVDPKTHPYIATGLKGSKFGIAHAQALAVYRRAAGMPGIAVRGIDCHIGSQVTEIEPYLDALDRLLDLVEQIEADGVAIHHVDLGGGLGITYADESPPTAEALVRAMLDRIDQRGHGHRELVLEPGRSLVGNAGLLLMRALYLKPGESRHFCIVDAAMNDMVRPAMYEAWMNILPCTRRADATMRWDIVGPVCESGDWLARDRELAIEPGDLLAMLSAGAYGMTMASNYNTRPRAAEVMVDAGRAMLIRDRERVADLFAHERVWD
jgi:diaminopimelate decarboxylase